jgi:hypothetical protein
MNMKQLFAKVRALGLTISCVDGEYRIVMKGGTEAQAYYTNDREDALGTAQAIAQTQRELLEEAAYDKAEAEGTL